MFGRYNNTIIFLVICIIMIALLYDTLLIKLYRFIYGLVFSETNIEESTKRNIVTFTVIAIIYGVGQYFVLRYLNYKNKEIKITQRLHINLIHNAIVILQFILVALLGFIILQMVITTSYSVAILFAAVGISYTLTIVMMGILADRFFSWFRTNRSIVVLVYGLATAALSVNAGFTLAYVGDLLTNQPPYIGPHILHISSTPSTNSILNLGYVISSIVSFLMTWIATALLLHHYSKKIGRPVYWTIVSIPLVYFLGQFQPLILGIFSEYRLSDPVTFGVIYTLVFYLSKPVGGILFGIAFWTIARKMGRSRVRDYLIISAYGIVLLFTSNQAIVLVNFDYPPFGLATASFVGLSSYLILVGIYSSAISISQDAKLRQTIKKMAVKESKLLDSIASAEVEKQIVHNVLSTIKANQESIEYEIGIETSMDETDVANYLQEAIKETARTKKRNKN
jgi:hypothetical protein